MDNSEREYWTEQLALWPGGYDELMLELTIHFNAEADELQMGTVVMHCATREVVGMEVHQERIRLHDEAAMTREVVTRITMIRDLLEPFPTAG